MFSSPRRSVDARPGSRSTTPRAGSSTEGRTSPSKSHPPRTLEPLERTTPDKGKGRATDWNTQGYLQSPPRSRTVYPLDLGSAPSPARMSRTTRGPSAVSTGSGSSRAAACSTSTQAHVPPSASHRSPLPLPSSSRWSTAPTSVPPQHRPPSPRGSTSETLLQRLMAVDCSVLPSATTQAVEAVTAWVQYPDDHPTCSRDHLRLVLALDQLRDRRWREELLVLALRATNVPSTPETDKRKMLLLAWKALVKWEQKEMGGQKRWLGGEVWAVVWEMVPRGFPYLDREEGKGFRLVTPDLGPDERTAERWIRQLDPPQGVNGHLLHASARASSLVSPSPSICSTASGQSTPIEILPTPPRHRDLSASATPRRNAGVSVLTASSPNRLSQVRQSQKSGSSREDAIDIEDDDNPPVIHIDEDDEMVDLNFPPSQRRPASQKTDTSFGLSSDITASQANASDRVEQEWSQRTSRASRHPLTHPTSPTRGEQPTPSQLRAVEEEEASNDTPTDAGGEEELIPPEDVLYDEHEDVVLSPRRRGFSPEGEEVDDGASEEEDPFEREETFLTADESPEIDGEETQLNEKDSFCALPTRSDTLDENVPSNKVDDPADDAMDLDDDPDAAAVDGPSQMSSSRYSSSQATSPEPPRSLFDGVALITLSGSDTEPKLATVQVYRGRDSFHYLWCQVEETGESSTSPKLELMVAAVNKIERTVNWVSALDGERVTVHFDESWDAFLAVFQSLFESGSPPSPSRKVVIDLLVADDDPIEEEDIEDEEEQPAQFDADMHVEAADDAETSGEDEDFEAEMDDAQQIEDYLLSEPQAAESDVRIDPYALNVTVYSFTLPRPSNTSNARPFKPPSKCAFRVSVLRHFEGAETVVTRQHHSSLLSPSNPSASSDGTIFLSSPLDLHVDSSLFAALDLTVPTFAGQLGLPPASALILHIEFVQLADAGGRPSRWFLDAFGSDSFDAVRLPEAKIRLASRTEDGELVRGGVGEDGEGSAALRLRGKPVRDGWLDLKTDWIEEGLGMGDVAEVEIDEEEEEDALVPEAGRQDAPAALMSDGDDLTDDEDEPAFKYIQGGQEPGFYAVANASSTAPVASVIRHAITLAMCGVDCARLNDFLVVKPADGSLAEEAIRNMSFDWRTGRGLVAVTEDEVNAVKRDMARYTSFTNWCSASNRYFIVCPLNHVVKCNVVFGGQINTYKMANHHFGPNMTKFMTKQPQDDLSKKRKADELDEGSARPSTIRRLEPPQAPSPESASAASPPLVWPSSSPVAAIASPKVFVQPPSSFIGPPIFQQHVEDLPEEDRFLDLFGADAGSSTSVGSASPSYLSTEAPTDDADETLLEHRTHGLPSRLPSVSVSAEVPPVLSAPPSPAEEIETEIIETITEEVSRTVITSESTSYSSATSKTITIVAGPSRLPHLAASSLLSVSTPASLDSSRSRSTSVLGTPPSLLDSLTPEQKARTLPYDPQMVEEATFPLVVSRPDGINGMRSQRVLSGTFGAVLEQLEKVSGDRSWRMRERDEAIFDLEGHHEGQKLVMCAWNRWVEKNAPTRIHRKIARKYTLGFVREYFDFLDKFGLHAFFVVHMTTLRTFELIDSKVFALALGRWGSLKRAKSQRAAELDSLAQANHNNQVSVGLDDVADLSHYPDMSWILD